MCASYMIKQRSLPQLVTEVRTDDFEQYYDLLIVPHRPAPVILSDGQNGAALKTMRFSLIPRWSQDAKPKFATHNARIETIVDKPTWREAFQKRHCLVPLTHFIEPIYEGDYAGHMVAFHQSEGQYLLAAGIWEEWANRQTGEVIESFSIITSEPPKFIADIGHDRGPVFLGEDAQKVWLALKEPPAAMVNFLNSNRLHPEYQVEKQRAMRPGWEKRK